MSSDSFSNRRALAVAFAVVLGIGIVGSHHAALARTGDSPTASASSGVIVVADKNWDHGDGNENGNWNRNGGNGNWNKSGNNGNGNWNKSGNNGSWNKNGGNKNWSGNGQDWNGNKSWNSNGKNWNKHGGNNWSNNNHWNNNWNRNWNNHAYVRGWSRRPYYGEFFGGVVLGSILAAAGAGIVPYSPDPELCWYWADPYMYRGYWDYCY